MLKYIKEFLDYILYIHENKKSNIYDLMHFNLRINEKKFLYYLQLNLAKEMKMNFAICNPNGCDIYKNGEFVKTVKYKKEKCKSNKTFYDLFASEVKKGGK